jgi:hypothetical protein
LNRDEGRRERKGKEEEKGSRRSKKIPFSKERDPLKQVNGLFGGVVVGGAMMLALEGEREREGTAVRDEVGLKSRD